MRPQFFFAFQGDGKISLQDLKETMNEIGEDLNDSEISDMIEEATMSDDSHVTFQDFLRLLNTSASDVVELTEQYVRNKTLE